MGQELLEALNEMNDLDYTSLEDAVKEEGLERVMDAWLRYEGIIGYTSSIIRAFNIMMKLE